MQFTTEYVRSLENLITDRLLPVYVEYQRKLGNKNPTAGINSELLKIMKTKQRKVAVLLQKNV